MFPCPLGGVVIDTPGMREMGAESADLSTTFAEIEELAQHCRFHDWYAYYRTRMCRSGSRGIR